MANFVDRQTGKKRRANETCGNVKDWMGSKSNVSADIKNLNDFVIVAYFLGFAKHTLQIPPEIASKHGKTREEGQSLYSFTRQEIDAIILELQNNHWPLPVNESTRHSHKNLNVIQISNF